jgi:hypothetical protein
MAEGTGTETPRRFDRARFDTIKGRQYPSVTTVLARRVADLQHQSL